MFFSRINVTKAVRACERARLWSEVMYLYTKDGQVDNAVKTMMERAIAFNAEKFLDIVVEVRNQELLYKAIAFFVEQLPPLLGKLLSAVMPQLDHTRVVHLLKTQSEYAVALAQPYLEDAQKENLSSVNTVLNDLYLNEEDYSSLRSSIEDYPNFDQIVLAQEIESHELLEFRR